MRLCANASKRGSPPRDQPKNFVLSDQPPPGIVIPEKFCDFPVLFPFELRFI
jgi:hypothetical protein